MRYSSVKPDLDASVIEHLAGLRARHRDWGYRKLTRLLQNEGFGVNHKRIYRICKEQGWLCEPPQARSNKARGDSQNACHIRQATCANQVWAIDFVKDRTMHGKPLKVFTIVDEYSRECLAIEVRHTMNQREVADVLLELFKSRGVPEWIRSDNGGEFSGKWIGQVLEMCGSEAALIAPGSPWQNGKNERFNGILSQEVLSKEVWGNALEAQVCCNQWKEIYNQVRPHGSLGLMTPEEYATQARLQGKWHHQPLVIVPSL